MAAMTLLDSLRHEAASAPESGIVAAMNYGRLKPGLIPLWAGEGDETTPDFIREAAIEALRAGETFYTWQRGIPELREALARYHARHFGRAFRPEEFLVTASGMQSIQLALQAIAGAGDDVIYLSPAWPNFAAAAGIAGIEARPVLLRLVDGRWTLDLSGVEAAVTPRTRALFINTPSNPTGWTASRDELAALLAIARRHGLWIIADEIYALFHYGEGRAASFLDVMDDGDRVVFVNSFSKNWAMTGWRVGWILAHPSLQQVFENLIQYSTSGVAQFIQKAAVRALDSGDGFIAAQVAKARANRDRAVQILSQNPAFEIAVPQGAFYLFFRIRGVSDPARDVLRIIDEAGIGLAPGTAFGPGGEGCFRMCFLRRADDVSMAAARLSGWSP